MTYSVLVVDDSQIVLESVKGALSGRYEVHLCDNPLLIPQFLVGSEIDLVLLDVNMPALSGPEAVTALRGIGLERAKIVLYSSEAEALLEQLAEESEVCGSISKSTPMAALGDAIAGFLGEVSFQGLEALVFARRELHPWLERELGELGVEASLQDALGVDRAIRSSSASLVIMEAAAFQNLPQRLGRLRKRGSLEGRRVLVLGACEGEACLEARDREALVAALGELLKAAPKDA